jgi:hypothetical protein
MVRGLIWLALIQAFISSNRLIVAIGYIQPVTIDHKPQTADQISSQFAFIWSRPGSGGFGDSALAGRGSPLTPGDPFQKSAQHTGKRIGHNLILPEESIENPMVIAL